MSYANQITVKIAPREARDKNHLYTPISLKALQDAMTHLKGESIKLWLYLSKNVDGYALDLSAKACSAWGLKKDAYKNAKAALIDGGYLVPINERFYLFYEIPKSRIEAPQAGKPQIVLQNEEKPLNVLQNEGLQQNVTFLSEKPQNVRQLEGKTQNVLQNEEKPQSKLDTKVLRKNHTTLEEKPQSSMEKPQRNNIILQDTINIEGEVSRDLVERCFIDYTIDEELGLVYCSNNKIFKLI